MNCTCQPNKIAMPTTACFCSNAPSTLLYGVYQALTYFFPHKQRARYTYLPVFNMAYPGGIAVVDAFGGHLFFKRVA